MALWIRRLARPKSERAGNLVNLQNFEARGLEASSERDTRDCLEYAHSIL